MNWIPGVFVFIFSLLLLHEMDAIRTKEWRMFIILKSMREEVAYMVFSIIHLPLYFWIILAISQVYSSGYAWIYLLTDVFLVFHTFIHFGFRRHQANGFKSVYSNVLIYMIGILAVVHLMMIF